MSIQYPAGTPQMKTKVSAPLKKTSVKKASTFSNRGMILEEAINNSNQYYLEKGLGVIYKKPTPIQIVQVDYPKRSAAVIKEAYFRQASTTDYNGVYKGFYLDFEAKETKNKTSFPLSNFHLHQITHFKNCLAQQGICFAILYFTTLKRCFLLEASFLIAAFENQGEKRKSIPLKEIEKNGYEITLGFAPQIPYLAIIDQILKGEKNA